MQMATTYAVGKGGVLHRFSGLWSTTTSSSSLHFTQKPLTSISAEFSWRICKSGSPGKHYIACSAVQESSTTTAAADTKEEKKTQTEKEPIPKAKPPAKAPAKPLPEMMLEDVIPPLRATLEAQEDLSDIELSFYDNKLEGSFLKQGVPYSFWAFFPNGSLTGPKGFSLSSYGSGASTVEPFLIDEKKITANHVVFWVEKRLAAQGIIPVWRD